MKPILFSTEMVKAIMDGRKVVTRRVVKPQPDRYFEVSETPAYLYDVEFGKGTINPPCQPGDILWVRETWAYVLPYPYFYNDGSTCTEYIYKASEETYIDGYNGRWKPSIHMPRAAARLFLLVKNVRVERLNQITNEGILREGLRSESCNVCVHMGGSGCESCFAILKPFRELWDSLNAKRGYSWDSNPWVWVIEFRRVDNADNH